MGRLGGTIIEIPCSLHANWLRKQGNVVDPERGFTADCLRCGVLLNTPSGSACLRCRLRPATATVHAAMSARGTQAKTGSRAQVSAQDATCLCCLRRHGQDATRRGVVRGVRDRASGAVDEGCQAQDLEREWKGVRRTETEEVKDDRPITCRQRDTAHSAQAMISPGRVSLHAAPSLLLVWHLSNALRRAARAGGREANQGGQNHSRASHAAKLCPRQAAFCLLTANMAIR